MDVALVGNKIVPVRSGKPTPSADTFNRRVLYPNRPKQQAINVKHAVRQSSQEGPAPSRRAPTASSATIIHLSAAAGGGTIERKGESSAAPEKTESRRGSGGTNLVFGGILGLILLIACLAWEVMSDRDGIPHAALEARHGPSQAPH